MSFSAATSPSRASFDIDNQLAPPTLFAFLHNVPPQLTMLLAELSPYIAHIRKFVEAISWKSEYSESWLLLCLWWPFCLFSGLTFSSVSFIVKGRLQLEVITLSTIIRYLLVFLMATIYMYLSILPRPRIAPPIT